MRRVMVGFMGAAILAVAPSPVRAQVKVIEFIVSPYVGVFFYDDGALAAAQGQGEPEDAIKVKPGRLLGARLGVVLIDRLAVIGTMGFAHLKGGSEDISNFDFRDVRGDMSLYHVALRFTPFPHQRLSVSGHVGVGGATTDFDIQDVESVNDVIVTAGIGVGYRLNRFASLRGGISSILEFCDQPEQTRLTNCLEDANPTHVQLDGSVEFSLSEIVKAIF